MSVAVRLETGSFLVIDSTVEGYSRLAMHLADGVVEGPIWQEIRRVVQQIRAGHRVPGYRMTRFPPQGIAVNEGLLLFDDPAPHPMQGAEDAIEAWLERLCAETQENPRQTDGGNAPTGC